jgi:hypothetical protein
MNVRLNQAEGSVGVQLEKVTNVGVQNANVHLKRAESAGPSEPKYPYGTCINHMFSHSWSDPVGYWVWVRKGAALEAADLGLGFPARSEEIQRFGHRSRRVVRVRASNIDERSFAEVVAMNPGRGRGQMQRGGAALRPGGRGVQVDLVRTEALRSLRGRLGTKIGTRKRVIERGPTTTTPTAQDFKVDTGRRSHGMSSRDSILTRGSLMIESGLTGRSRN